jgi:hypothetical protein
VRREGGRAEGNTGWLSSSAGAGPTIWRDSPVVAAVAGMSSVGGSGAELRATVLGEAGAAATSTLAGCALRICASTN